MCIHYCSHSINLVLYHACKILAAWNCIGTVKAVGYFLRPYAERIKLLKDKRNADFHERKQTTLILMRETRWVKNHKRLMRFREIHNCLIATFEEFIYDSDTEVSSKSSTFLKLTLCCEFIISLCSLALIFSCTSTVCKLLQSPFVT